MGMSFNDMYLILRISCEDFGFASAVLWIGLFWSGRIIYEFFTDSIKTEFDKYFSIGVIAITVIIFYYFYNKYNLSNPATVVQWKLYFKTKAIMGL